MRNPSFAALPYEGSPGGHLVLHEIITLQLAVNLGTAAPSSTRPAPRSTESLVARKTIETPDQNISFPGVCTSDNDPGIDDPTVYY